MNKPWAKLVADKTTWDKEGRTYGKHLKLRHILTIISVQNVVEEKSLSKLKAAVEVMSVCPPCVTPMHRCLMFPGGLAPVAPVSVTTAGLAQAPTAALTLTLTAGQTWPSTAQSPGEN